ncbi:hypothetical protein AWC06_12095 [Mycobacterium fragae]|uniref:Uncharacterized protein n=1 Tax=Mycobacterium fragae TaxID=1260918 RepID=A0A1X1UXY5_9MYCO|nr:hypothetical protein AWC06_12095 [Mycobacterium fragae]
MMTTTAAPALRAMNNGLRLFRGGPKGGGPNEFGPNGGGPPAAHGPGGGAADGGENTGGGWYDDAATVGSSGPRYGPFPPTGGRSG